MTVEYEAPLARAGMTKRKWKSPHVILPTGQLRTTAKGGVGTETHYTSAGPNNSVSVGSHS